eukprot:TRINITY_DN11210_c0_g1_i1.p1 TRINITY_DN11210_c0_g1~~TRINITY_DN11210_c0_g1_i1.p1  ORF type:complete len:570 (+),score=117.91 TRINITY_DN11210_c0_g1_i1:281-1990(+)
MVEALAAVHAAGIIHGDVRCENFLLNGGSDRRLKLIDFGTARDTYHPEVEASQSSESCPPARRLLLPPEAARGDAFDRRGDLWSLGCSIFELVTGVPASLLPALTSERRQDGGQMVETVPPVIDVDAFAGDLWLPLRGLAPDERDLILQLTKRDPDARIGGQHGQTRRVLYHPLLRQPVCKGPEETPVSMLLRQIARGVAQEAALAADEQPEAALEVRAGLLRGLEVDVDAPECSILLMLLEQACAPEPSPAIPGALGRRLFRLAAQPLAHVALPRRTFGRSNSRKQAPRTISRAADAFGDADTDALDAPAPAPTAPGDGTEEGAAPKGLSAFVLCVLERFAEMADRRRGSRWEGDVEVKHVKEDEAVEEARDYGKEVREEANVVGDFDIADESGGCGRGQMLPASFPPVSPVTQRILTKESLRSTRASDGSESSRDVSSASDKPEPEALTVGVHTKGAIPVGGGPWLEPATTSPAPSLLFPESEAEAESGFVGALAEADAAIEGAALEAAEASEGARDGDADANAVDNDAGGDVSAELVPPTSKAEEAEDTRTAERRPRRCCFLIRRR